MTTEQFSKAMFEAFEKDNWGDIEPRWFALASWSDEDLEKELAAENISVLEYNCAIGIKNVLDEILNP